MRWLSLGTVRLIELALANRALEQTAENSQSASAVCNFEDGNQISARYTRVTADHSEGPATGKVWMPGGSAIALVTLTELTVGSTTIPPGSHTMYLIPGKKDWKLVVSKNVRVESKYDEKMVLQFL